MARSVCLISRLVVSLSLGISRAIRYPKNRRKRGSGKCFTPNTKAVVTFWPIRPLSDRLVWTLKVGPTVGLSMEPMHGITGAGTNAVNDLQAILFYIKLPVEPYAKETYLYGIFGMAFCAGAQESTVNSTLESIDSVLDYKIGTQQSAGRRIGRPAIDLNYPKAGWNVGASCSGWSADAGVSGLLNDAESQFNRLQRRLVNSLTGFVTQLPMLLIQREDPGMYELLNSTLLNGEDMFDARVATCRQMSERFAKNGSMGELQDTSFWMEFSEQERQQRFRTDRLARELQYAMSYIVNQRPIHIP